MDMLSPDNVLKLMDDWMQRQVEKASLDLSDCTIERGSVNFVLKCADLEMAKYYRGNKNPSPLKVAACYAYAIAREQPLSLNDTPKTVAQFGIIHRATALRNSEMGLDSGLFLVSNAEYDCKGSIKPPFDLKYPSEHFRLEVTRNLSLDELNAPALAYIYELILLGSEKGRQLAQSLDRRC